MDGALYDMILRRKSFHIFRNAGDEKVTDGEIGGIMKAYAGFDPLFPGIRTAIRIVPARETTCRRGEEYCILMYSEKKDGYLQNIGYLGEQLDLYLVSRDVGTLWYGIGKTDEKSLDGMDFVIMIAIRKISDRSRYRLSMTRAACILQKNSFRSSIRWVFFRCSKTKYRGFRSRTSPRRKTGGAAGKRSIPGNGGPSLPGQEKHVRGNCIRTTEKKGN